MLCRCFGDTETDVCKRNPLSTLVNDKSEQPLYQYKWLCDGRQPLNQAEKRIAETLTQQRLRRWQILPSSHIHNNYWCLLLEISHSCVENEGSFSFPLSCWHFWELFHLCQVLDLVGDQYTFFLAISCITIARSPQQSGVMCSSVQDHKQTHK